jgi:hypothetical protein
MVSRNCRATSWLKLVPATSGRASSAVASVRCRRWIDQQQGAGTDVALSHHGVQGVQLHIGGHAEHVVDERGHRQLADRPRPFEHFQRHRRTGRDAQRVGKRARHRQPESGGWSTRPSSSTMRFRARVRLTPVTATVRWR